jgi:hypothetical protein
MFALLPYLWIALMLAVVIAPIVAHFQNQPRRKPKAPAVEPLPVDESLPPDAAPLDFVDELAEVESSKN